MRITLLGREYYVPSLSVAYRAMSRLGHVVQYVPTRTWALADGSPSWIDDTCTAIKAFGPDVILAWTEWKNAFGDTGPIHRLREIAPVIYQSEDDPSRLLDAKAVTEWRLYDGIWANCADTVEQYREAGVPATVVYPPTVDAAVHRPVKPVFPMFDVCLSFSSLHTYQEPYAPMLATRAQLIDKSCECANTLLTALKDEELDPFKTRTAQARCVSPEQLPYVYCRARINVGQHSWPKHRGHLVARDFEVPACGAFYLTDKIRGLDGYFEPGVHCGVYTDADDFQNQVMYWLDHGEERRKVARAGYERVTKDFQATDILDRALAWTRETVLGT